GDQIVQITGTVLNNFCIRMAVVIEYLHFGAGMPGGFILFVFNHIEHDAAVSTRVNSPLQHQLEVLIFIVCDNVTTATCYCVIKVKGIVIYSPSGTDLVALVVSPA